MEFSETYDCTNPYTTIEFYDNGTFKQFTEHIINSVKYKYYSGVWKLSSDNLVLDVDDSKYFQWKPVT